MGTETAQGNLPVSTDELTKIAVEVCIYSARYSPKSPPYLASSILTHNSATQACDAALQDAQSYDHEQVSQWSSQIINKVLQSLIAATTPSPSTSDDASPSATTENNKPSTPPYRFNVNCTIIQQGAIPADAAESPEKVGRRGMHSASGAYWDVQRDGMWTYKYPGATERAMDLVLNVVWFGTS
ncbi:hypothetical protein AJ80_06739 [Polytolypa hystricis UAMH7299]|uniref:Topoisomerase I damage affected protein 2 n=1 Tax=Polytolypa hystricis (strain UAMH7299) TaxID=1447883 RepID=A0A2B7XTN9_POLH7|nr:hypothetical protein AJ80_06739 [Polytolypa hystricis UAMH7299]